MYLEGKGVKKDTKKAIALLNNASKMNESQADVLLARLYLNGTDVKQDLK
jgi:TPR repeat protein